MRAFSPRAKLTTQCGCTADDILEFWPHLYGWRFPPYALTNLSGNIKRQRDRLPGLRQLAEQRELVRLTLAPEEAD